MMNKEPCESLSPLGDARREAMLGELMGAMTRLHRRKRRIRRAVISSATTIIFIVAALRFSEFASRESRIILSVPADNPQTFVGQSEVGAVAFVHTDPTVSSRFRANPPSIIVTMDDEQLVTTLAEVGRPAGLIRFGERVALSAPVTDEELRTKR